ncbi:MAG: polyphosphate kinase 1 [Planctomycetes bacterium]|nr:polyphosphate kinase 1 [Planctomycetota bacterium]
MGAPCANTFRIDAPPVRKIACRDHEFTQIRLVPLPRAFLAGIQRPGAGGGPESPESAPRASQVLLHLRLESRRVFHGPRPRPLGPGRGRAQEPGGGRRAASRPDPAFDRRAHPHAGRPALRLLPGRNPARARRRRDPHPQDGGGQGRGGCRPREDLSPGGAAGPHPDGHRPRPSLSAHPEPGAEHRGGAALEGKVGQDPQSGALSRRGAGARDAAAPHPRLAGGGAGPLRPPRRSHRLPARRTLLGIRHRRALEIGHEASPQITQPLCAAFDLEPTDVYQIEGPVSLGALMPLTQLKGYAALHDEAFIPQIHPRIVAHKGDLFSLIRQSDLLLHHPYQSFQTVVDFLNAASDDPDVLAIKITLYRTGRDSPIMEALERAAEHDKQVTALIELKARFEEEANIVWARRLERAGVHVVYGLVGLKTHAKIAVVVRRDPDRLRRYVHFSTGNYNPVTARTYTDLALMTCDEKLGDDAAALFNLLTGYSQVPRWNKAIVSPSGMREKWIELIERETAHQKAGREARIIAKLNALVDGEVMSALVKASQAGVPIDLLVRGICCLRPGLPGITENIRVRSIVGRYLEHSRVVYFANGGQSELFLTSADWMPRNFVRRVEIAIPVERPELRQRLVNEVLGLSIMDNAKAWELHADGTYARLALPDEPDRVSVQRTLQDLALGVSRRLNLPPPMCGTPPAAPPAEPAPAPAPKPGREPELFAPGAAPPAAVPTPGTSRLSKATESPAAPPPPNETKAAS